MIFYREQDYINDLTRLVLKNRDDYSREYTKRVYSMSIIELEKEVYYLTGRTYTQLTGDFVGF